MKLGVAAAVVDGIFVPGDVEVEDGRIAGVGLAAPGGSGTAVPGFVDLQVNGFGGVDFPQPEGPTSTRNSPSVISSETSSTAATSPNLFVTSWSWISAMTSKRWYRPQAADTRCSRRSGIDHRGRAVVDWPR